MDERQGVVRVAEQIWPFELDLRSGTVSLRLTGKPLRLRRPSWREKRNLARFTHLGEGFLREQFLRLSLADGGALPESPAAREALWALSRWLSGPRGHGNLPLDPELLARVTLELCRSMGWSPAVLEDLEADEVESLWRTAGGDWEAEREGANATRIVVVPDPEPGGAPVAELPDVPDSDGLQPITPAEPLPPEAAAHPGGGGPQTTVAAQDPGAGGSPQPDFRLRAARLSELGGPGSCAGNPSSAPGRKDQESSGPPPRFRVVLGAVPPKLSGPEAATRFSVGSQFTPSRVENLAAPTPAPACAEATQGAAVVRMGESRAGASIVASMAVAAPSVVAGLPTPPRIALLASAAEEPPAAVKQVAVESDLKLGAEDEWETLLEEFADRLEAAAGAMGIDVEP